MADPTPPAQPRLPPALSFRGMADAACGLAAAVSLSGFAGGLAWWLDIASHFRVQYALFFAAAAAAQALARRRVMALLMAGLFGIALLSRLPVRSAQVVLPGPAGVPTIDAVLDLDGTPVRLLATHPLPPKDAEYSALRNGQLERLAEIVRVTEGRVILAGDLNATPWSAQYRRLVRATGLRNSAEGRGVHPTWPVQGPLLRIPLDHFLYRAGITVLAHRTGAATGSDHFPIVVDFGLTR